MAALMALETSEWLDFTTLAKTLELTDGNLGAHLTTLEQAGLIEIRKQFVARKPRTDVRATRKGRRAFEDHVEALQAIIASGKNT